MRQRRVHTLMILEVLLADNRAGADNRPTAVVVARRRQPARLVTPRVL